MTAGPRISPRLRLLLGAGLVAVVAVAVTLALAPTIRGWLNGASEASQPQRTERPAARQPVFTRYEDPRGRFAVSYPQTWRRVASSDPQVALLARAGGSSQDSMLVRVADLPEALDPDQLDRAKRITDALVEGSDVRILVERRIDLSGRPGFYYLYTFGRPRSDRFGIHAHYFVFGRSRMYVLVMQALPDTHFIRLAPLFDRVAQSFQIRPGA